MALMPDEFDQPNNARAAASLPRILNPSDCDNSES